MSNSKRILIVVSELQNGGAQRVASRIAGGIASNGFNVRVLELFHPLKAFPISENVEVVSIGKNQEEYQKLTQLQREKRIREEIIKYNPDVIIPFLDHVCQKVLIATFATKHFKRVITTLRNSPYEYSGIKRKIRDFAINVSGQLVVQNEKQKQYFSPRRQKRTIVIANPIDEPKEEHQYNGKIQYIVAAGRLTYQKNYYMMLDAIAKIPKHYNLVLSIYGRGEREEDIKKYISKLGLEDRVFICGYCNNISDVYHSADLFLMTSDYEGMPNSLMEAMAEGLPCISTDCQTGPGDLLVSGESGILIPVGDANACADAILKLVKEPKTAIEMGKNAKKTIQRSYTLEVITKQWIEAFRVFGLI